MLLQFQQNFAEFYQMNSLSLEPNLYKSSNAKKQQSEFDINADFGYAKNESESARNMAQGENSLELMIRAHQRIRTLQEDNEILRMHVDLLSKDNKELNRKLQISSLEKNELIQKNELLQRRLQQMQIKLQGFKVKEQLHSLENDKFCRRAKYDKYEQISSFKASDPKSQLQADKKDVKIQQQVKNLEKSTQINKGKQIQKLENIDCINDSTFEKSLNTQKNQYTQKNFSYYVDKPKISFQQAGKRNRSEQKSQQNHFTPNKCSELQKSQNKFSRNLSHKQFSNYEYINKSFDFSNDRSISRNNPNLSSLHDNYLNKNIETATSDFYSNKNTELRTNSPLIRKNSPNKTNACQFHPHKRAPSSYGSGYGSDQNLSKKFNYTNWRKANNNLLVWRLPTGSGHNKPIFINR